MLRWYLSPTPNFFSDRLWPYIIDFVFFSAAHRKSIEDIKCVTCGLELKTGSALLKHKNKVHRGMKFVCDICNKEYTDYSNLKRHKKNVHNVIMGRKLNFSTNNKI